MNPKEARFDSKSDITEALHGGRAHILAPSTCDHCKGFFPVLSSIISCHNDGSIPATGSGKLQKAKKLIAECETKEVAPFKNTLLQGKDEVAVPSMCYRCYGA